MSMGRINGYDWGLFPGDAAYSVFSFYVWFLAAYFTKEELLGKLRTLEISVDIFTQIEETINEIFTIGEKTKVKAFPLMILFHFFVFVISLSTYVCNFARFLCTISNSGILMLITLTIVYFFPVLLAHKWI
jgi:hypothetical protein